MRIPGCVKNRYFLADVPQPHQLAIHQDKWSRPPAALRNAHWLAPQYKVPQCSSRCHWMLLRVLPCRVCLPDCPPARRTESLNQRARRRWCWRQEFTTGYRRSVLLLPLRSRLVELPCSMKERRLPQPFVARCKLVLVGDVQCGKTAMLQVLAKDCYPEVWHLHSSLDVCVECKSELVPLFDFFIMSFGLYCCVDCWPQGRTYDAFHTFTRNF